ncbi:MAG: TIGR03790 family protein [Acidobacteria bacterium]|nr:TIGR03790 family protein [Acidobacteriota bacterium]
MPRLAAVLLVLASGACAAGTPAQVLVVENQNSARSRQISEYYVRQRSIPLANLCRIQASEDEQVTRAEYIRTIETGIRQCLIAGGLVEQIHYIVLTQGVPLRIKAEAKGSTVESDAASVDSELVLLYARLHGTRSTVPGPAPNPYFRQLSQEFGHPKFPMYLVTRLAAYTMAQVKRMIDHSVEAGRNPDMLRRGKVVLDLSYNDEAPGNSWLRNAMLKLSEPQVVFDASPKVITGTRDVIGYAGWGSNDKARRQRFLGMTWLPGSIATEFVSSNGRTLVQPPDNWTLGEWKTKESWYAGSPQSLTGDYLAEGATAATGHVEEPYLVATPHPEELLPAYVKHGRNLAESFYLSIAYVSWMNICLGDPLMKLAR